MEVRWKKWSRCSHQTVIFQLEFNYFYLSHFQGNLSLSGNFLYSIKLDQLPVLNFLYKGKDNKITIWLYKLMFWKHFIILELQGPMAPLFYVESGSPWTGGLGEGLPGFGPDIQLCSRGHKGRVKRNKMAYTAKDPRPPPPAFSVPNRNVMYLRETKL